jgi:tetraacyldisaccharide-1-P 4'-kinase
MVIALRADRWRTGRDALDGDAPRLVGAPPGDVVAVTAIAQPALFLENARRAGARVADVLITFPDHHDYDAGDAARIEKRAAGRAIVTTAKDWIKLHTLLPPDRVYVLEQRVEVETGSDVLDTMLRRLTVRA